MSTKTEETGKGFDTIKLIFALVVLIAAMGGFYQFEDQPLWMRLLGLFGMIGLSLVVVGMTTIGRNSRKFLSDAQIEVRKVVWPSRQETIQMTLIIFIAVLLTSLFLWGVDSLLFNVVRMLTGQEG